MAAEAALALAIYNHTHRHHRYQHKSTPRKSHERVREINLLGKTVFYFVGGCVGDEGRLKWQGEQIVKGRIVYNVIILFLHIGISSWCEFASFDLKHIHTHTNTQQTPPTI